MSLTTYIVTSFDFGGRSDVKLHVATDRLDLAEEVYASVLTDCNEYNATHDTQAGMMLVELTHIPKDTQLLGPDALTLFWGDLRGLRVNNNI